MKRSIFITIFVGMIILMSVGYPNRGIAEGNVNARINPPPPPPLVIPAPPPVVVIPRTYVYFAPRVEVDIFFYRGYWYRPFRGHWYRSVRYNGAWVYIPPRRVPAVLINLPPDFRRVPPDRQHIPYEHLKKNWSTWEKEKYWDKHGGKEWHGEEKGEHKEGKGRGRGKGEGKGKHGD
jgi:hypothetical protein